MSDLEQDVGVKLLVSLDDYLSNGVHVGLKYKSADMRPFIYKIRPDKLCVFDVQKIDERLRLAAQFIASYKPEDVLVVSNRVYGREPIKKFSEALGFKAFEGRFVSGTLTNPSIEPYCEPKLLIVTDPTADQQAIKEARSAGVAVLAICDTNTRVKDIDFVIPSNNKGKNSLGLIYWVLTREILKLRGIEEFDTPLEEFISKAEPQPYLITLQERQKAKRQKKRGRRR
ncbi:MAG: 30S ribosomal protein S2 [Candidatus Altiarchaeales archaeon]|nr:30S ribosomal protein S2 [Candidatus Altiarchaeales archaeon]MBD3415691.1 30S ribosomal protein S2 [Candidatus Altiarchaeales archaeon]